jgi:hypothetical protein
VEGFGYLEEVHPQVEILVDSLVIIFQLEFLVIILQLEFLVIILQLVAVWLLELELVLSKTES